MCKEKFKKMLVKVLVKVKGFFVYYLIDKAIQSRRYHDKMIGTYKYQRKLMREGLTYEEYDRLNIEMEMVRKEFTEDYKNTLDFLKFDNKLIDNYKPRIK